MGVFSGWTTSEIKRLALYLKDAIGWSSQPEDIQRIFNMIVDAAIAREDLDNFGGFYDGRLDKEYEQ